MKRQLRAALAAVWLLGVLGVVVVFLLLLAGALVLSVTRSEFPTGQAVRGVGLGLGLFLGLFVISRVTQWAGEELDDYRSYLAFRERVRREGFEKVRAEIDAEASMGSDAAAQLRAALDACARARGNPALSLLRGKGVVPLERLDD